MTPPTAPARRLVLVPMSTPRREPASRGDLRRYQLARLALDGRRPGSDKLAHLRQMHD